MNHMYGRTSMPNIQVKGNFVLKLLFGHIDTHTRSSDLNHCPLKVGKEWQGTKIYTDDSMVSSTIMVGSPDDSAGDRDVKGQCYLAYSTRTELNWTEVQFVTRTPLWTLPLEYTCSQLEFSSVHWPWGFMQLRHEINHYQWCANTDGREMLKLGKNHTKMLPLWSVTCK